MAPVHEGLTKKPRRAPRALKPARLRNACDQCHAAKVKCSGEKTGCGRCTGQSLECIYSESRAGKVPGKRARNHDTIELRPETPVQPPSPVTDNTMLTQSPTYPFASNSTPPLNWSGDWATGLNLYEQTDALHDSMQALMWSPGNSDFATTNALPENLDHEMHASPSQVPNQTALSVLPHSQTSLSSNDHMRCNGGEKGPAPIGAYRSPLNEPAQSTNHSTDTTTLSGPVFSDTQGTLADIPSLPTLADTSPSTEERLQSMITTTSDVGVNTVLLTCSQEAVCIDEARFVHVVCQLIESLQHSITTQVRVLDLLLSMAYKTVNALGTLVRVQSGRHIKISPHCFALLFSCMFQVVKLATLGRNCLREEMATEAISSGPNNDEILDSLDFAGLSSDVSYKRVWRARRAADRLDSMTQEVRTILVSVSSVPIDVDGAEDENQKACLSGIVRNLERLVQAYREMSRL